MYHIVQDADVKAVKNAKESTLDIGGGRKNMKIGNCMICNENVYILNCHYQCQNCGYAMNWEEGQDIGQVDQRERESINGQVKKVSRKKSSEKAETTQLL